MRRLQCHHLVPFGHQRQRRPEQRFEQAVAPHVERAHHHRGMMGVAIGAHARHPPALVQEVRHRLAEVELGAVAPGRARERRGGEIGIGVAGVLLVAEHGDVVGLQERQDALRVVQVDLHGADTHRALLRERRLDRLRLRACAADDEIAAPRDPAVRFGVVEIRGEIGEYAERAPRELHVLRHGVVRAQDAARLRSGAFRDPAALDERHAAGAQARQVVGHGTADHAAAEHDRVVRGHQRGCLDGGWTGGLMRPAPSSCPPAGGAPSRRLPRSAPRDPRARDGARRSCRTRGRSS